jgi:hypothetical protein
MAKSTGPLFSLQAHGDIANLMTYTRTKGKNVVRAKPVMPIMSSPELDISQGHHANAVAFYRNRLASVTIRDAWKRHATYKRYRMSAYDTAMKAMLESFNDAADPAHTITITPHAAYGVQFKTKGVASNDDPDEAGDFTCWYGPKPDALAFGGTATMYEAQAVQFELPAHTWPIWVQLFKNGIPRSGILLLEAVVPPYDHLETWWGGAHHEFADFIPVGQYNGFTVWYTDAYEWFIWSDAHPPTPNYLATFTVGLWEEEFYAPADPSQLLAEYLWQGTGAVEFETKAPA